MANLATIIINKFKYSGKNIIIGDDNCVIIDGKVISNIESKHINISIEGDLESLKVTSCNSLNVKGNVDNLITTSGDVEVNGNVSSVRTTSGDVKAQNVNGNISTISGDISCIKNVGNIKM